MRAIRWAVGGAWLLLLLAGAGPAGARERLGLHLDSSVGWSGSKHGSPYPLTEPSVGVHAGASRPLRWPLLAAAEMGVLVFGEPAYSTSGSGLDVRGTSSLLTALAGFELNGPVREQKGPFATLLFGAARGTIAGWQSWDPHFGPAPGGSGPRHFAYPAAMLGAGFRRDVRERGAGFELGIRWLVIAAPDRDTRIWQIRMGLTL